MEHFRLIPNLIAAGPRYLRSVNIIFFAFRLRRQAKLRRLGLRKWWSSTVVWNAMEKIDWRSLPNGKIQVKQSVQPSRNFALYKCPTEIRFSYCKLLRPFPSKGAVLSAPHRATRVEMPFILRFFQPKAVQTFPYPLAPYYDMLRTTKRFDENFHYTANQMVW